VRPAAPASPAPPAPTSRRLRALGWTALAALAYVPLICTAPGTVAADTKQYLYLDPGRLLSRAAWMWDPNIGMGTVTHQNIGYLFPMGPYYAAMDAVGAPDWVAQRLWLGSILFAAAAGVLYLARTLDLRGPGVVVAAVAYAWSPYVLHYAARISVILLPWAALGWMVGLTVKAVRAGGWRHAALFALLVQVVGSVNATALVFAGIAPALWLLWVTYGTGEVPWRRALAAGARIAALTAITSAWWIAGLSIQGGYGINILRYTETVRAVARTSLPNEVLRGLGYWFFYGRDRLGPWIESSVSYTQRPAIILAGYALASLALLSAGVVRWRHRGYFVLLALVGTVVAVGAHPYDSPTPLGGAFKSFATSSTAGLALRSTGRATPLVVLALAVLLGLGVGALHRRATAVGRPRVGVLAGGLVVVVVLAGFPALWDGSYYGRNLRRDEDVPAYWREVAAYLDARDHGTRVLELPGADFASYTWGSTVDPITPGLIDRPYVARELIPYGTAGTADLLDALDRRFQEGVADPRGVADVLRRMGVGDVVLRNDIQDHRYDLVAPRRLARVVASVPGLERVFTAGGAVASTSPFRDERDYLASGTLAPRAVEVYEVDDATPIVRVASAGGALVVAGDGEGLVDAADVGLLADGRPVLYTGSFGDDAGALRAAGGDGAVLVLTDSNRRRARRWSTVRDNTGYTEARDERPLRAADGDARLPLFPDAGVDAQTVVEQRGVERVVATGYGNPITFTPEDRPARALDGDVATQWRTAAFEDPVGQRILVELERPITTDRVGLVQPIVTSRERYITEVRVHADGTDLGTYDLGPASRTPDGESLRLGHRTLRTLELTITATALEPGGGAAAVGFAEIRLRDERARADVRVDEVVRMPADLLDAYGEDSLDHALVVVTSRLRGEQVPPRTDEERALARVFDLPTSRSFALTGTARLDATAGDDALDRLVGPRGEVRARASASLDGCLRCRADAALDDDPATAWRTPIGAPATQWVEVDAGTRREFDRVGLRIVADGRHSVPTRVRVETASGAVDLDLPDVEDADAEGATSFVPLTFGPLRGDRLRVTVLEVRAVGARSYYTDREQVLPVGIAELGVPGIRPPTRPAALPARCRADLLTLDGRPLAVRVSGSVDDALARAPLTVEPCDPGDPRARPTVELGAGEHVVRAATGASTGIDLDRLVLASAPGGAPLDAAAGRVGPVAGAPPAPPALHVVDTGRTRLRVRVDGADEPFWLVLGESHSRGWTARVRGGDDLGAPVLVDGYANAWRVDPHASGTVELTLEWTPQRRVWAALAVSVAATLLCLLIVWRTRRRRVPADHGGGEVTLAAPWSPYPGAPSRAARWAGPAVAGAVGALCVAPWVGLLLAALVALSLRVPRARAILALGAPVALGLAGLWIAASQVRNHPPPVFEWPTFFPRTRTLGWLAIVLVAADVLVARLHRDPDGGRRTPVPSAPQESGGSTP
jgi:hypothetical protein